MNGSELGLTGYDDLFETDESREIKKQLPPHCGRRLPQSVCTSCSPPGELFS